LQKRRNQIGELKAPLFEKSTKMDEAITLYQNDITYKKEQIQAMEKRISKITQDRESLKQWMDEIETYSQELSSKEISNNIHLQSHIKFLQLQIPCKRQLSYKFSYGSKGSGDGQFKYPSGIAVDSEGNIIVADNGNHRIQIFNSKGKFLRKFGKKGVSDGHFYELTSLTVDSKGNIIVIDGSQHRIQVFNSKGVFLRKLGTLGYGDGQFSSPVHVTVDRHDNIFVSDHFRIQKFDSKGKFLMSFALKISPNSVAVDSEGNIIVLFCKQGKAIEVLDSKGRFMMEFCPNNNIYPCQLTIDSNDNVYVTEASRSIHVYDSNGIFVTKFGYSGIYTGLAVDRKGNIFTADSQSNIIQVLH